MSKLAGTNPVGRGGCVILLNACDALFRDRDRQPRGGSCRGVELVDALDRDHESASTSPA